MYKYLILYSMILSQAALACDPVKYVKKGEVAPCTGYLFTPDKELEVRKTIEELKTSRFIIENNAKLINLKDENLSLTNTQLKLWQDQSSMLSKQLVDRENSSFWKSTFYFVLGAAVTTGLAFAVNKATK